MKTVSHNDCPPLDDLIASIEGRTSESIGLHLNDCARCQTELALFREFESAPMPEERESAQWIAQQVRDRQKAQPVLVAMPPRRAAPAFLAWKWPVAFFGLAAALAILAVGIRKQPPTLQLPSESEVFRSGSLEEMAPTGDLKTPPAELRWKAVPGAQVYQVRILEVDHAPVWSAETRFPSIVLPAAIQSKMLPFKTLLWEVTARSRGPNRIIGSATQRIRVIPTKGGPQE